MATETTSRTEELPDLDAEVPCSGTLTFLELPCPLTATWRQRQRCTGCGFLATRALCDPHKMVTQQHVEQVRAGGSGVIVTCKSCGTSLRDIEITWERL